ncbi:hypothetical protein M3697_00280 [Janibacter melonis]|nr:VOC family protein [Janibacter melonis]MCM3553556.1 hypothetical protein [Janibacter melonis]
MARTLQVTIDAADPETLSRFWAQALGYRIPPPPGHELGEGEDPLEAWHAFLEARGVPQARWGDPRAPRGAGTADVGRLRRHAGP